MVGGGVAGLTVARDLARAGHRVTVLEAGERVGGCVSSVRVDGLPDGRLLDSGAESFATRTTAVADLLGDLGLGSDVVLPQRLGAWVLSSAGPVPLPAAGLLGVPVTRGPPTCAAPSGCSALPGPGSTGCCRPAWAAATGR